MNYIDSLLKENKNFTTNSDNINLPDTDPLLTRMQQDAEERYYNQLSGSTYSSEPKRLSFEEIAAKKEARLAKKRDELIEDDSNFTLKAKSAYNYVNDLWGGTDLKANYMGKSHSMSNKIFEDTDATIEESQVKRQELIDQYNMAEDDQNARHKVYQLRLKEGVDENGNPIYSYKTGIAETSAAERYKNQYIRDGYEILSEKGFAGAEEWENRWHGLKSNLVDRTYDEGINSQGQKIKDLSGIGEGYSEVYNTQAFDFGKTDKEIAQNMAKSQALSDANDARRREGYGYGSDSIVDSIQAGGLKVLADTGDMILDVVTPGDNTFLNDAKDQTKIDKYVGYNRKSADKAIGEATANFKQGNYAKAVWEIYKEPQIIAESIPAMAEMIFGVGKFTKVGKAMSGLSSAQKAGDYSQAAKYTKELAENISTAQKGMYRVAQNAGLLTFAAGQTNNQVEERVRNNREAGIEGGDSIGEVGAVFASNLALYGLDRGLFTKITGIGGGKAALSDAFGFSTAETKKSIMKNIANKALTASIAGGAEGGQEYFQTWGEIINEQLGTGANGGKGFLEIIKDSKNIDESIGGLLAGTVGGVQMRQASDTVGAITDKAFGISKAEDFFNEKSEREKYAFTSGSNWFDGETNNNTEPTYEEALKTNVGISRTRGEIKSSVSKKISDAIYGRQKLYDINNQEVLPADAINNTIDTLKATYFGKNAYNDKLIDEKYKEAELLTDEDAKNEMIAQIRKTIAVDFEAKANDYANDMIDTFSNMYSNLSDPKSNQSKENSDNAKSLVTSKFIEKINAEPDEVIKNTLLSKFTNEMITDLASRINANNEAKEELNNLKGFGSQPDSLLFSKNAEEYIKGLNNIREVVFGSQSDRNRVITPAEKELSSKIDLFSKEYRMYKARLENAKTDKERSKIIRGKRAEDVSREIVDGSGFILDLEKPNGRKSISVYKNAINKGISKIASYNPQEAYEQTKGNKLSGILNPIDALVKFSETRARNMSYYDKLKEEYSNAKNDSDKREIAKKLFDIGIQLDLKRSEIDSETFDTDDEVSVLGRSSIPSYRIERDNISRDTKGNPRSMSTGASMIFEAEKFLESLEATKILLESKVRDKELLINSGSLKKINKDAESAVMRDIDTLKKKITYIEKAIALQKANIKHIAESRKILSDPVVYQELNRIRNESKSKNNTQETEQKVETEQDTQSSENIEPATKIEDKNTEDDNKINQGENNENIEENRERRPRTEDRGEQTGDSKIETENQEGQNRNEEDGSRDKEISRTREEDTGKTELVSESETKEDNEVSSLENSLLSISNPSNETNRNKVDKVTERANEKILEEDMKISKAAELAIKEINAEESIVKNDFKPLYEENDITEIENEIRKLRNDLRDISDPENSIEYIEEKYNRKKKDIDNILALANKVKSRKEDLIERAKELKASILADEEKLAEIDFDKDGFETIVSTEKKIIENVVEKSKKEKQIENKAKGFNRLKEIFERNAKRAKELQDKINLLKKLSDNESIRNEKKIEVKKKIRELEYKKEKIKYNLSDDKDNSITLALKDYQETMNRLDLAQLETVEYAEALQASKIAQRLYLNEKQIDREIRKNIVSSLERRKDLNNKSSGGINNDVFQKAIDDVKNYGNGYQDLFKNKFTFPIIAGSKTVDSPLALKADIPQFIVDYSEKDNSVKGYIKVNTGKKQFGDRLVEGIFKKDSNDVVNAKVLANYYKMKGKSYEDRLKLLYPTKIKLKNFEKALMDKLSYIVQNKIIDTDLTYMKPVSISPEAYTNNDGKMILSDEVKDFNSKYREQLDNPEITIENGKIVAKIKDQDGNTIILDDKFYDINTLALLFKNEEKNVFNTNSNYVVVPEYAQEIMKTELIREISNMYSIQNTDPDYNDGKDFDDIWGVNSLDSMSEVIRNYIKETFADKGYIPLSVITRSLGQKIYKALPLNIDKNNIEKDAESKIQNQLAMYALSALSRKNSLGISIYSDKQDIENEGITSEKEKDTMVATVPVSSNEVDGETVYNASNLSVIRLYQGKEAEDLIALSDVLEYTDPAKEGKMPSNSPIETTSDTIKNKNTPKSDVAKETIIDYQSVGYRFEQNIKELYNLWKDEKNRNFAYQIAGIMNPDSSLNAREYKKKLSKNRNERIQFDTLMRFFEEKGHEKEFYIKWDMIASGRYMEDSRITPQNNKITRFLLSTAGTRTNIEFTKDEEGNVIVEPEIMEMMKRSVAQALDYDLDKDLDTFVLKELEKDISIKNDGSLEFKDTDKGIVIKEAIEVFKKSLVDAEYELTDEDKIKLSKITSTNKDSFHAYQAVRELAKFDSERENFISGSESKHNYDAHMVIEADGITSGMMIILSQMMTKDAQKLFEKGGIYTKEAVEFWTHTAKALGLEEDLRILGENTLSDGSKQQKITHGLLNRIGKIVSKDPASAKEKLRDYWIDKGIKGEEQINELVERANFKDFYNTIAYSVTGKIKSIKSNIIPKEIKKLEERIKEKGSESEWEKSRLESLKLQYALIDVVGDEIGRKLAKDPVMVFIYGSSLGSIKNKILNGLIGDSIQGILNSPDKITEGLTRADGNQSLGIILNAIGIDPYLEDNRIRLDLNDDIKLYDIVNSEGVDNLVVNKSRDISIEEARKILVDSKIMKNLFLASFETYGKAFEDSFNDNFQFINRYRDILKSIEMVRFEIFDKKFTDRVNKLISDRSGTNKDGAFVEYNPTNSDLDSILMDLVNEGFGHAIRDINGGYHSFEKTERANSDRRYSLRTIHKSGEKSGLDGTSANSLGIREFVSNVGAAPVTSIHNQDGWQIRYATIKENIGIQNIFDALISGLMNHKGAVTKYNEGYSIANSMHSILQSQMKDMENLLNSLTESEKDSIFNNMSNKKAEDIMFVYDKIRNPKDAVDALKFTGQYESGISRTKVNELVHPQIELNMSLDRMLVNSKDIIESSAETINDISFGHLYATDLAEQYVGNLGGIKNENASTETVFNAFFELIATATHKTGRYYKKLERDTSVASYTGAKYVVENKLANNEKEKTRIMKTFDTMMPDKIVSKEAKSKINEIIEKLVNCKP